MSKKIKVLAMLMGLIMTLSLVGCGGNKSASGEVKVGDEAPEFYADLTNGKSFILSENKGKVVLINFWATWCGPCRALGPILEDFANEYTNVKVGKINVDEQPELASQFRVMSIPTLLLFKDGEVVKKSVGLLSKDELVELTK